MTAVHSPLVVDHRAPGRSLATPTWLRTVSTGVVALALVAGLVGVSAVLAREHAAHAAAAAAEPLVVDAETLDVAMSDANTSIAGGFLSGPVVPTTAESPYESDLAQAAATLTAAAQRSGGDARLTRSLTTLTTGLAAYRAAVATAEAANRQGYPLGAAYLAEANNFMRTVMLPAADSLYRAEQGRLAHEDSQATNTAWLVFLLVLMVVLLGAALWLQFGLARRFRRLLNVGVLAAVALIAASALWAMLAAGAGDRAVSSAERHGTAPLGAMTEARILAQQVRADDELTLLTRDSDSSYQSDLAGASTSLTALLNQPGAGWTAAEADDLRSAATAWSAYKTDHTSVRSLDRAGQLQQAENRDARSASDSARIDASLAAGVATSVRAFGTNAASASQDLGGLAWGLGILMIAAAVAVLVGVEPRIREYR